MLSRQNVTGKLVAEINSVFWDQENKMNTLHTLMPTPIFDFVLSTHIRGWKPFLALTLYLLYPGHSAYWGPTRMLVGSMLWLEIGNIFAPTNSKLFWFERQRCDILWIFTTSVHIFVPYITSICSNGYTSGGTLWQANGQLIRLPLIVHVRQA